MYPRVSLLALAFLTAVGLSAAEPSLTVDEIVARHIEARGGYGRLMALRTLVYSEGLYSEADYEGSGNAMMAFARPYHRVVGNPADPGGYMEGYDGAAWEWFADPGIVVRTVGAAAGAMRRGSDIEGVLADYRAKGSTIKLEEPEKIDGRPAYRLVLTLRDGFVREYFLDQESFLVVAERRSAPFHAFGEPVTSETRIGDWRPASASDGVLFAHSYVQTEIATGKELSRMQWRKIEANRDLPRSWFSPPEFERTALQTFLEQLFGERADKEAVLWSYDRFRKTHPDVDTRAGVEAVGYQMLKMGDHEAAIALLEENARAYPDSSSSAFGLGRAYASAGRSARALKEFERALKLDPENRRATRSLADLEGSTDPADNPLGFLEPFIGDWGGDVRPGFIAFRFEWTDPRKRVLRFVEGLPDGDYEQRILENFVTFNPRTGEVVALGYQLLNDFLYESTFRPQDRGYVREYKVTYPPEQEFRTDEDRSRGWIQYRDRCRLVDSERLHCVTEQMRAGEWQPWGDPDGYTLVRK